MATTVAMMARPQRWDTPFGPNMTDDDVALLLERPEIASIEADRFPEHTPLTGILKNDTRIGRYKPGEIVVREGDYGNSAFLVFEGDLRVVLAPDLPRDMLGRQRIHRKNFFEALSQLWTNRRIPELRDPSLYAKQERQSRGEGAETRVVLQDVPAVLDEHRTARLGQGALFGELAALGRVPRTATVFAETDTTVLEIRWQGLREIRKYDDGFRRTLDERYRENALNAHLRESELFSDLDEASLQEVANSVLFETYGSFDWNVSYRKLRLSGKAGAEHEPVIARQGDYPDGVLLVRAGFARVSVTMGKRERTLTYLGAGDHYAIPELYRSWREGETQSLETSLTALGYVDVLRVPSHVLEEHVFPKLKSPPTRSLHLAQKPLADAAALEWAVDGRFINGTKAMLIDLDRCTRCDDCVRACASTHGGNPRFVRHGRTYDHWMVANACMHCTDPVCMIGCPTGAIHRSARAGMVVINDETCIGCATCANSCPYNNIRMVEIRDVSGNPLIEPKNQRPILKATKCDLCAGQLGGPACVRACPHDALRRVDFEGGAIFEGGPAFGGVQR